MKQRTIDQLSEAFKEREAFSAKDLFDYWTLTEGPFNKGTSGWRIYELKQKRILQEIKKGWYTLKVKPTYTPVPDKHHIIIDNIIRENYRKVLFTIWNTNWLNEFSVHQFNKDNLIIEIEKDLQESLRDALQEEEFTDLAWSIGRKNLQFSGIKNPVFILPLITRAPLQEVAVGSQKYQVPTLEKILVDIYDDLALFYFLQGAELERIFEHAISRYAINFTTLFGYAKRRNKEDVLKAYLKKNFPSLPSIVTE
ncbi:MAG TPA: DUF6577 family protein [Puia sp.]|nr:DUF6577 family protein [Puia sp.]